MERESRWPSREVLIAGLIALAATAALVLDTRMESRAYGSDRATFGARRTFSSPLAPLAQALPTEPGATAKR